MTDHLMPSCPCGWSAVYCGTCGWQAPLCGAQDAFTSGRCGLPAGHDGLHHAIVGAGARQWEATRAA